MNDKRCFLCGRNDSGDPLERHHIFGGANRKKSEKYGLVVYLCGNRCGGALAVAGEHDGLLNPQPSQCIDDRFGLRAQRVGNAESDFRREFGKSYL